MLRQESRLCSSPSRQCTLPAMMLHRCAPTTRDLSATGGQGRENGQQDTPDAGYRRRREFSDECRKAVRFRVHCPQECQVAGREHVIEGLCELLKFEKLGNHFTDLSVVVHKFRRRHTEAISRPESNIRGICAACFITRDPALTVVAMSRNTGEL